jgi:hypothetical protein
VEHDQYLAADRAHALLQPLDASERSNVLQLDKQDCFI